MPTQPTRCVAGQAGFQDENRRWQALLGESRGCAVAGVGGAGWGSGWWRRGCALSSSGHRRQSGTCREVKRRWLVAVLFPASRRLTSRQNPDRASPARPRREHTPRGSVWAAPGPAPGAPVAPGVGIYIPNSKPILRSRRDSLARLISAAESYIAPVGHRILELRRGFLGLVAFQGKFCIIARGRW